MATRLARRMDADPEPRPDAACDNDSLGLPVEPVTPTKRTRGWCNCNVNIIQVCVASSIRVSCLLRSCIFLFPVFLGRTLEYGLRCASLLLKIAPLVISLPPQFPILHSLPPGLVWVLAWLLSYAVALFLPPEKTEALRT